MLAYNWARSIIIRELTKEQIEKLHNFENTDINDVICNIDYGFKSRELAPFEISRMFKKSLGGSIGDKSVSKLHELINKTIEDNKDVLFKKIFDNTSGQWYQEKNTLEQIHYLDKQINFIQQWEYKFEKNNSNNNPKSDNIF